ncbi:hypothetical protein EHS25_003444 [Saitozyma podzolica]|uniref:Uncharacterized protein n=1 Tax=Saitozyma podzolica TaxID=1890683 RepID=A0A427Y790_9TREE|nr:hypothetical protein EHS25_003444 [Saitozyma podzolica]
MPADGVGFRMVSTYPDEVINYDCFAELADDPQPTLVLLGLYPNGTYTFLRGSGERVGGCVVVDP